MKHWHRCQRWTRRGMSCPFMVEEEHEDTEDTDEFLDFTKTPRPRVAGVEVPVPARIPVPQMERELVRVREPRRKLPTQLARARARTPGQLAGAPGIPEKPSIVTGVPDIKGTPIKEPQRIPIGRVRSGGKNITVREIMREAEKSVGKVPERVKFSNEDTAFLQQNQIADLATKFESQSARAGALQTQMAEEAAAEAIAPTQSTQVDVMRELVNNPPAELIAIPLLAEAFRQIRKQLARQPFRSPIADPRPHVSTPKRTPIQTPGTTRPGRILPGAGAPRPGGLPVSGFGVGGQFNAAERMRQMVGVSRNRVLRHTGQAEL